MSFVDVEARRAWQRRYYAKRRDHMVEVAARTRAAWDPDTRAARRAYAVAYRRGNPHKMKHHALMRDFGLTVAEFQAMLVVQGGVCAICAQPEKRRHQSGLVRDLSVDHDHATGRIRGLLCSECNWGIGKFGDDPDRLRAAAAYLTEGV